MFVGGLGKLMVQDKYEVWLCVKDPVLSPCAGDKSFC